VCQFIAAQAQVDLEAHGGRNPLADQASRITISPSRSAEDDELEEMRGEPDGWVSHEEGVRKMRQATGHALPDTIVTDGDGNVVGDTLTAEQPEAAGPAPANPEGSFEAFMSMFGGGGTPPPRGPVPG
jgi:hypothetical protein